MVEALEGKGMHMALSRGEAQLGDHLRGLTRQVSFGGVVMVCAVAAVEDVFWCELSLG